MLLTQTVKSGGKILLCGNGGSSADCEHISGELLKDFLSKRCLSPTDMKKFEQSEESTALSKKLQYGICAIPLPSMTALFTAFCNDVDPAAVYAQLVFAVGRKGDALLCISTSGDAENVCNAAITGQVMGMRVLGLTGRSGGRLAHLCGGCIQVYYGKTCRRLC